MTFSGKTAGVEFLIIQMGDKGDPYHFTASDPSAPPFKTNVDGEHLRAGQAVWLRWHRLRQSG